MTAERHMVAIETERTGKIVITPGQFDMLLAAAVVGLDEIKSENVDADVLFNIVSKAMNEHAA